jgi:tetratricopeptide (TPR) repeat protein
VTFTRTSEPDDHFSHLAALQELFDHDRKSQGLDAALLARYKALDDWLGSAEVKRVAWADPASDAWYTLLTGQNYADLGNDALALEYYTFAVRHFPASYDAYGARGQLLERSGRYKEALPDLTRAAALLKADHRRDGETEYSWRRDRVR